MTSSDSQQSRRWAPTLKLARDHDAAARRALRSLSRSQRRRRSAAHRRRARRSSYSYETREAGPWSARPSITIATSRWTRRSSIASDITGGWAFLNRSWYPDKKKYPWIRRVAFVTFNKGGYDRDSGRRRVLRAGRRPVQFLAPGISCGCRTQRRLRALAAAALRRPTAQRVWLHSGVSLAQRNRRDRSRGGQVYYRRIHFWAASASADSASSFSQPAGSRRKSATSASTSIASRPARTCIPSPSSTPRPPTSSPARSHSAPSRSTTARGARVLTDFLSSYEPRPGTVVYVGYGSLLEQPAFVDGHWVPMTGKYRTTQRGLFLKASYLYRF